MLAGRPASTGRLRTAALPHWQAMRGALLALLLIVAGAVLVPASGPTHPRGRGPRRRSSPARSATSARSPRAATTSAPTTRSRSRTRGVVVGTAEAVARASRAGGQGSARAAALARRVDLFDGTRHRHGRPPHRDGDRRRRRLRGPDRGPRRSRAARSATSGRRAATCSPTAAPSIVNKGRSAIRVTLGAARGDLPAGTRVDVAVAAAPAPPTRSIADPHAHADAPPPRRRRDQGEEGQAPQGPARSASA